MGEMTLQLAVRYLREAGLEVATIAGDDGYCISNRGYAVTVSRAEFERAARLGPDAFLRGIHDRLLEAERQATAAMRQRVEERMPLQYDPIYREIL